MPRGTVIATTLALGVGMASLAGAAGNSRTARGWVSEVDADTRTIKLKGKNDEVSFRLGPGGRVTDHQEAVSFDALAPGEHVRIRYAGIEDDRVALEVDILARAEAEETAESAK